MTEYLILRQTDADHPGEWNEFAGVVRASSARRALAVNALNEGVYVAVPARSWKPLTVKVEQTTKVTIG